MSVLEPVVELMRGLGTTLKQMFDKPVTIQYPEEKRQVRQRFRGRQDLVLLHIDPARLRSEVRYENLQGGAALFPHVYGAIPIGAVLNVTALLPGPDGTFGGPAKK